MKRTYGWQPDLPDARDWKYAAPRKIGPSVVLPPSVDLRPLCPPVVDQGELSSCTGNALAGAIGFLEMKAHLEAAGRVTLVEGPRRDVLAVNAAFLNVPPLAFDPASRLFIYYNERDLEGTVSQDAGAMIRDGIKVLTTLGSCSETDWPYDVTRFTEKPSPAAFADAAKHLVTAYARVDTPLDMKACLAEGYPAAFGFTVYDSFESEDVAATGVVPMPDFSRERSLGGHAVLAVGYFDDAACWLVRNSWGEEWGMAGYFLIPYAYVDDLDLADDRWTIRLAAGF